MRATDIINNTDLPRDKKLVFLKMAMEYDKHMPDSLYLDPYELARGSRETGFPGVPGTTPELWEEFLDLPEMYQYRRIKIGKETENGAIKAMRELMRQGLTAEGGSKQVQALKEILNASKLLQKSQAQQQQVVMSFVPPIEYEESEQSDEDLQ